MEKNILMSNIAYKKSICYKTHFKKTVGDHVIRKDKHPLVNIKSFMSFSNSEIPFFI